MNIMDIVGMAAKNPQMVKTLAGQFGLDEAQAGQAISGLLGALGGGMQKNLQNGGLDSLEKALQKGNHQQFLDEPETLANTAQEGNKVLGHILGSKETSRAVADQVAQQTGIGGDILKQMLPMIAMAAMGSLSKSTTQQSASGGGLAGLIGAALDRDGDGNPLDDILGMLGGNRAA